MNKGKIIIGLILVIIICMTIIYGFLNWNTLFMSAVEIEYPDGCVEYYIDGQLNSSECIEGRISAEQNVVKPRGNQNFTFSKG